MVCMTQVALAVVGVGAISDSIDTLVGIVVDITDAGQDGGNGV